MKKLPLIEGTLVAQEIMQSLQRRVAALSGRPTVVFIRIGEDPASVAYVNKKTRVANQIGIGSRVITLPTSVDKTTLFDQIDALNADPNTHGILVQAPLPDTFSEIEVFNRIAPEKDVDGFHAVNLGKLCQEDPSGFISCTPAGILELLKRFEVETAGRHAVVVGRSLIVGKPMALLLSRKTIGGNATVTLCHSRTTDLKTFTRQADLLIVAMGRPGFITAEHVKPGVVVVDVGINRIPDQKSGYRLVGDVDFDTVAPLCDKITPVPGGVGPMTVAMLMRNTIKAFQNAIV